MPDVAVNVIALLFAASLSAGSAEFDRVANEGAAQIALVKVREDIAANPPSGELLRRAMLDDPASFVTPQAAKPVARDLYRREFERIYAERSKTVVERLGVGEGMTGSFPESELEAVLTNSFASVFDRERQAACAEQARALVTRVRPTEAEFEAQDEATLTRTMTDRIVREQSTAVFEENLAFISERLVTPVLEDGRKERRRQTEYLMRTRTDACSPSALRSDIVARLQANVSERRAKAEDPSREWGIFPSVTNAALAAAIDRRVTERFVHCLENAALEVGTDEVWRVIASDPAAHIRAEASEKLFRERYAGRLLAAGLAKAVQDAPAAERSELAQYLEKRLSDERCAKSVESRLRQEVMPRWRTVRAQVSADEAAQLWPTLNDGTWFPAPDVADSVAARADYQEAVRGWRNLSGLEDLANAPAGRAVMEEAAATADVGIARAFDRARSAIAAQNAIVDRSYQSVLDESRRRKDGFWTRTPDLAAVADMLSEAAIEGWREERREVLWPDGVMPKNAEEQHVDLFPSVRRKIELLSRLILEEMNQPVPERRSEPQPPEDAEPDASDSSSDSSDENQPMIAIAVKLEGDSVEVSLKSGKSVLERQKVPARQRDFDAALRMIGQKLGTDVLKLK